MKREAWGHWKVEVLRSALALPRYAAVGLLESLWQLAAQSAPAGDIGHLSDLEIAAAVGWDRDPCELIQGLLQARWLDKHAQHRLVVHDWPEHCEDGVHRKLARAHKFFCDGSAPKIERLEPRYRTEAQVFYASPRQTEPAPAVQQSAPICAEPAQCLQPVCAPSADDLREPSLDEPSRAKPSQAERRLRAREGQPVEIGRPTPLARPGPPPLDLSPLRAAIAEMEFTPDDDILQQIGAAARQACPQVTGAELGIIAKAVVPENGNGGGVKSCGWWLKTVPAWLTEHSKWYTYVAVACRETAPLEARMREARALVGTNSTAPHGLKRAMRMWLASVQAGAG